MRTELRNFVKSKTPLQATGIKLATLQSNGVFGLRSASVGTDHAPPAHSTPRGIVQATAKSQQG